MGDSPDTRRPPSSVSARRLALCGDALDGIPDAVELGLEPLRKVSFEWQQQRSRSDWNEFAWTQRDLDASVRVREIHGMFGMVAEAMLACIEAEVEEYLLVTRLEVGGDSVPLTAARTRAVRFFADGQANQLTTAGHLVANLAWRTLALHPDFAVNPACAKLAKELGAPRSSERSAWASLNGATSARFSAAADALESISMRRVTGLVEMAATPTSAWGRLAQIRGRNYHRWRGASPGVTGVDLGTATAAELLAQRLSISIDEYPPPYTEGGPLLDELLQTTTNVLAEAARWMCAFMTSWAAAFHRAALDIDSRNGWNR